MNVDGEEKKKKMRVEVPINLRKDAEYYTTNNNNNNNKPVVFASAPTKVAIKTDAAFDLKKRRRRKNDDDDDDDTLDLQQRCVPSPPTRLAARVWTAPHDQNGRPAGEPTRCR